MMATKWIQAMHMKKGTLRRALGAKVGKNISKSKLRKAAKKGGLLGKRARLALTLSKLPRYHGPRTKK
jgi:hypothetical protein